MNNWQPFTVYRTIEIEKKGTPATGQEYRITGHKTTFACLTCCKRQADTLADRADRYGLFF